MSSADNSSTSLAKPGSPWWRSSLYQEPAWVSLAWIIGPMLVAGLAIFYVVIK